MTTPHSSDVEDGPLPRSDEELVAAARAGDDAAYAQLWERHVASARRAARAVSPHADPDDIVSEAFTSILSAIRKGGGPQEGFRPYLFATVRNVAASWGRRTTELPLDDLDERAADSAAEFAELVADRSVLAQAFRELPERWRTLLWYIEVEGMKPREVAPLLGMTPNAVSALVYRAREGFKQAWLHAHVSDPARPAECRWACEVLVVSEKKPVRRGDRRRLDAHLRECPACRIVAADLEHVSQKLRMVLLPLVLGGAGALAYSTDATPAVAAVVTGSPTGGGGASGSGETGAGSALGGGVGVGSAGTAAIPVAGIAVALGVAAVVTAGAVVFALAPWGAPAEQTAAATPAPVETDAADDVATAPDDARIAPDDSVAEAEIVDAPIVAPGPVADVVPAPAPRVTRPNPPPAVDPPAVNPAPDPVPTPSPTPTPTPTTPPPARAEAPVLAPAADVDTLVPGPFTGSGIPGAVIALLDESDQTLAETTVDPDGTFAVLIPADLLRENMTVRAVQTAPDLLPSEPSAAVGPFPLPAPVITAEDGSLTGELENVDLQGPTGDLTVLLSGIPGQTVIVYVDGVSTGNHHVLADEPLARVVQDIAPGEHVIGVRYIDPATFVGPDSGPLGRLATFTVTAVLPQ
ncbi:sigma-70 family RNA polymerase sigma factor [Microbacterium timonense]|uniref:sigma-70 family RNA polymerase sigma factor n=1 Tax=Microbacterium timonense TaxID=2086576 RepID=UPI000D10B027|nr:sigma-70 family RNA polymerase sigma factor [Microbacterium timonense]